MHRLIFTAAFALLLAVPVWAQRGGGGGHVGGGMHAGGFGGHAGGFASHGGGAGHSFGGVRSAGGMHPAPGPSRGSNRSFHRSFSQNPYGSRYHHTHNGWHGGHYGSHHHHYYNGYCYGYGCRSYANWGYGYPWWGWGYDPSWWGDWDDQDQRFDEDYYRQYEIANEMNQQSLEQQQMLRQEEADGDQDSYAPRSYSSESRASRPTQADPPVQPTVLVYRDQHRQEIQNYAIAGETLWAFTPGRTQRIALADLDLTATEKANEERGLTFAVPRAAPVLEPETVPEEDTAPQPNLGSNSIRHIPHREPVIPIRCTKGPFALMWFALSQSPRYI